MYFSTSDRGWVDANIQYAHIVKRKKREKNTPPQLLLGVCLSFKLRTDVNNYILPSKQTQHPQLSIPPLLCLCLHHNTSSSISPHLLFIFSLSPRSLSCFLPAQHFSVFSRALSLFWALTPGSQPYPEFLLFTLLSLTMPSLSAPKARFCSIIESHKKMEKVSFTFCF